MKITSELLDDLGFSEYWSDSGCVSGERCFGIEGQFLYRIKENDEVEDVCGGYCQTPCPQKHHFSNNTYPEGEYKVLETLQDIYEDMLNRVPVLIPMFLAKCEELGFEVLINS